jgi:hypothetical protein
MAWLQIEGKASAQEPQNPRSSPDWPSIALLVVFGAAVLAMAATWFLDARFPIPNDNAIYLALLGFFFVLFIIFPLAVWKFLQGQGMTAVKSSLGLLLLGLLAALAVGSLPLLWRRLVAALPWVQEIPWSILLVLWLTASEFWRRRRRPTQDDQWYSRKALIFKGSALIILVTSGLGLAVSEFSDGKAWLGAFYLMAALLFGLFAVDVFVEIWKRRGQPRDSIA